MFRRVLSDKLINAAHHTYDNKRYTCKQFETPIVHNVWLLCSCPNHLFSFIYDGDDKNTLNLVPVINSISVARRISRSITRFAQSIIFGKYPEKILKYFDGDQKTAESSRNVT